MDLRLRERRFLPPFFALRLAERRAAFFLPPFLAEAFLREERLLGAMVSPTEDYGIETRCCKLDNRERHKQTMHNRNSNGPKIFFKNILWTWQVSNACTVARRDVPMTICENPTPNLDHSGFPIGGRNCQHDTTPGKGTFVQT